MYDNTVETMSSFFKKLNVYKDKCYIAYILGIQTNQ